MPKRAPGRKIFFVDMDQIDIFEKKDKEFDLWGDEEKSKGETLQEGVSISKFIPSKTNHEEVVFEFSPSEDFNQKDLFTKNIKPHIEAIQKLIRTRFSYVQNYEFLVDSANEVLRILRLYLKDTKSPRFHWGRRAFMPPFRNPDVVFQLLKVKDCVNICKLVENERALLYPDSPGISEPNRLTVDKGHALTQPMLDQSIASGYHLPLNRKERKIWLDFKKLDEGNPESGMINFTFEEDEKRSINLSDPLVSVIGGFAVAAFNKACATHFKKDEQNNVHDFEYMECKYVKETKDYFFYLTIEAIEEGNLGVYEAIVVCSRDDGSRKLLKFVLTDRAPAGMKAMAISLFSCLISTCKTLELVGKARSRRLLGFHKVARGMQQGKASHELIFYEYLHRDTVKGIRRVISLNLHLLFQKKCTRTTNSDAWYVPDPDSNTGLKPRGSGTPCRGYDYNHYNQYLMGRLVYCAK
uniref:uncharacterized protein LOC122582998 n=1 Tax=Erigeron canadensis TaxID=72917 RepID=UPI001CB9486F|nr:uncharacterized protein LOC122582998 [Erigeron canadensis]